MSREYILNRYKLAMQDFQLARNEDEQWTARKEMARLERLASELYGFDFADSGSADSGYYYCTRCTFPSLFSTNLKSWNLICKNFN